jgi:hypothetical protein
MLFGTVLLVHPVASAPSALTTNIDNDFVRQIEERFW